MNPEQINIDQGRQGYVVTPTFDEVTGTYGDFEVANNGILQNHQKLQDYQATNDTIDPDAFEPQNNIDDELVSAFSDANPDLGKAITFQTQFMSEEMIAEWNKTVDEADWFQLAPVLEQWLQQYREAGSPDVEENVYEEEPEFTQQQVDQEYNQLLESEPEGIEQAGELLSEAEEQMQQGNNLAAEMLMNASRFHSGSMTAQEAIDAVMNSGYSHDEIISTYYSLFN